MAHTLAHQLQEQLQDPTSIGPLQQGGTASPAPPESQSGYFDPATGNPIPTSQIGNYSFVKDAQGVFRSVTVVTDQLNNQFYEFNVADPGLQRRSRVIWHKRAVSKLLI